LNLEVLSSYKIDFHEEAGLVKHFFGFSRFAKTGFALIFDWFGQAEAPVQAERSEFIDRALTGADGWRIDEVKGVYIFPSAFSLTAAMCLASIRMYKSKPNCFVFLFQTPLASTRACHSLTLENYPASRPGPVQAARSAPAGKPGWVAAMSRLSLEGMPAALSFLSRPIIFPMKNSRRLRRNLEKIFSAIETSPHSGPILETKLVLSQAPNDLWLPTGQTGRRSLLAQLKSQPY
jgi:hypothetical protein